MIIQCEKCGTKFGLDESLLNEEGSKVRCSVCKHTFTAYPYEKMFSEDGDAFHVEPEKPVEKEEGQAEKNQEENFDNLFEESLEDLDSEDTVPAEDLYDLSEEEPTGLEEPTGHPSPGEESILSESGEENMDESGAYAETTVAISGKTKAPKTNFLPIFLVIILIIIGGVTALVLLAPDLVTNSLSFLRPPEKHESTDAGLRRLSFKDVTGFFVDSEEGGHLFVIRGMVRNDYPNRRSFILIKGSILDDNGRVVKRKLAYAGNALKKEKIKAASLEEIYKAMKNRYGIGRKNFNLPPGGIIPFTIVFESLPDNMSEFTVEAVSSSPGS